MQAYCLFIVLVTIIPCFYCFPLFPYGTGNGDNSFTDCDDCCTDPISLNNFPYFGSTYSSFTVGSNGIIILDGCVTTFTPIAFPSSSTPLIAPYWGDVDLRAEGMYTLHENHHINCFIKVVHFFIHFKAGPLQLIQ